MRVLRVSLLLAATGCVAAACNDISGLNDLTFGGASGDEPTTCPSGFSCGPASALEDRVIVVPLDQDCPPGSSQTTTVYDGNDPGCDQCTCRASGGTCSNTVAVTLWTVNVCEMALESQEIAGCVDIVTAGSGFSAEAPSQVPATCSPTTSTPLPLAGWRVCSPAGAAVAACGAGETCVPDSVEALCVVEDSGACPADMALAIDGWLVATDTRQCGCTCVPGPCAGAEFELYEMPGCNGSPVATFEANGMCMSTRGLPGIQSVDVGRAQARAGCTGTSNAAGSATFSEEILLCCPSSGADR
jgi:hypothetical protein